MNKHCGRAARYRADPAYHPDALAGQIPASEGIATLMRNYRTGLFRDTRVRKSSYVRPGTKANLTRFGAVDNVQFHHASIALALTATIEILPHLADGLVVEKLQTSQVARYAKVIEVACQLCIQQSEQIRP